MDTRQIGVLEVSVAGLGCNNFGAGFGVEEEAAAAVVSAALDAGVTFFDTAENYGTFHSEEFLGRALGKRRDQAVIVSKFGWTEPDRPGRPDYVATAIDRSLTKLGTDRVDLYCLHRPDPDTPIVETLGAMNDLITKGKVLEIGCSGFPAPLLEEAAASASGAGLRPFVAVERGYSMLDRSAEVDLLPTCGALDLKIVPYYPLAMGVLTGKYRRGETPTEGRLATIAETAPMMSDMSKPLTTDEQFATVEVLTDYARAHGHTLLELALSWLAANPQVGSVIAGATQPEQATANAAATVAWHLTDHELAEIEALLPAPSGRG